MTATETPATSERGALVPTRTAAAFAKARDENRTAVIPFVTVGYPTLERSEEWALALVRGGADLLEIGVPFSDPLADGATVQRTSQVALQNGVTLGDAVEMVRRLRQHHGVTIPLFFMGYVNPMLQYGLERLAADAAAAGLDGFIVPDLPAEESDELREVCRRHGLHLVYLLAPTSTNERIEEVARRAGGFIYCVSLTGVTGQRDALPDLRTYIGRVRARTDVPVAIGFGVSTPEHVRQVGEVADGAVVASAMINFLDTVPAEEQSVAAERFVRGLRGEADFPPATESASAAAPAQASAAQQTREQSQPERAATARDPNRMTACRGIRGATTVEANTSEDILEATTDLLEAMIRLNGIDPEEVVSAIFTTTPELTASFPAIAARDMGWTEVPLLCAHEMNVPGALPGVVRILLHVNTSRTPAEIKHIYLRDARALRPEWAYDDARLAEILGRRVGDAVPSEQPARTAGPRPRSGGDR